MLNVKNIYYIGKNTFKHIMQGRILINTVAITLVIIVLTFIASKFTYGVPKKIAIDIGLALLSLSSLVLSLSLGVGLINNEIESRTLYVILAKAVKRSEFLVGKILGLITVLILNIFILSIATTSIYLYLGGELNTLILFCMLFIILESSLLLLVAVLFSLVTNKMLTVVLSISIWCLGYVAYSIIQSPFIKIIPYLQEIIEAYIFIFPAFFKFNLKDFVIYEQSVSMSYLSNTIFYFVTYSAALIVASCVVFKNKDLD